MWFHRKIKKSGFLERQGPWWARPVRPAAGRLRTILDFWTGKTFGKLSVYPEPSAAGAAPDRTHICGMEIVPGDSPRRAGRAATKTTIIFDKRKPQSCLDCDASRASFSGPPKVPSLRIQNSEQKQRKSFLNPVKNEVCFQGC